MINSNPVQLGLSLSFTGFHYQREEEEEERERQRASKALHCILPSIVPMWTLTAGSSQ